jgi:hypothetical protein
MLRGEVGMPRFYNLAGKWSPITIQSPETVDQGEESTRNSVD